VTADEEGLALADYHNVQTVPALVVDDAQRLVLDPFTILERLQAANGN